LSLRDRIAGDLEGDLADKPEQSAIDRLLALSLSERTGTLAWRVLWVLDGTCLDPLISALAGEAEVSRDLAEMAVHEAMSQDCLTCRGRATLMLEDRKIDCKTCDGTGKRRYSDRARAAYLRMSLKGYRQQAGRFKKVSALLSVYEMAVAPEMRERLK